MPVGRASEQVTTPAQEKQWMYFIWIFWGNDFFLLGAATFANPWPVSQYIHPVSAYTTLRITQCKNSSVMTKEFPKIVDGNGKNDDCSDKDALPVGIDAEEKQTVPQYFQNHCADYGAKNRAFAAG